MIPDQNHEIHNSDETVSEESQSYEVHIDNFDGPLDLLWQLIKKAKIDITEISISQITEQYIAFLKLMEDLNVKIATEFIWMASELLYYKSKALLPSGDIDDEYFVDPLPPELIQKLLEYKKYQQASKELFELFEFNSKSLSRENDIEEISSGDDYIEVSLFDLLKAFSEVMETQVTVEQEEIVFDEILVSDRIQFITELLKEHEVVHFIDIFSSSPTKSMVVATFLAVLEMAKMRIIRVFQTEQFGPIRMARKFHVDELS